MDKFLSPPWIETQQAHLSGVKVADEFDGAITCLISGSPDGDVRIFFEIKDGQLVPGESDLSTIAPEMATEISIPYEEATKIARGTGELSVAFMQGKVKISGNMSIAMKLLGLASDAKFKAALQNAAKETSFE